MEKQEHEQSQPNEQKRQQQQQLKQQQEEVQQPRPHRKQELKDELEYPDPKPNPNPPPKQKSPPRQPTTNPNSPPNPSSPSPRIPYHNSKPQHPSSPSDSPPPEQEEQERGRAGDYFKKPRQPYYNSEPQLLSPLSDSPPQGQQEKERGRVGDDNKKAPPFNPPPITAAPVDSKLEPTSQEVNDEERGDGGGDVHVNTESGRRYLRANLSALKRARRDSMLKRALIVSRICGFVFSLVSFSVLAADRDRGWALDSFYRYKEFRYCMAVNVIAFVYSGFQGYDVVYQLTSGKHELRQPLRYYLDFSVDQVLTYLLISASSSAAVRVDDWQSNWGKDEFPDMARASVALSFLAFVALALSSLISGYNLCTLKSI